MSGDGCFNIARNKVLGCKVDGHGPIRGIAEPLHPDAELVHDAILTMPWIQAGLLIRFGKTGLAPELPPDPRWRPIIESYDGRHRTNIVKRFDLQSRRAFSAGLVRGDDRLPTDAGLIFSPKPNQKGAAAVDVSAVAAAWPAAMWAAAVRRSATAVGRPHRNVRRPATMRATSHPAASYRAVGHAATMRATAVE